MLKKLKEFIKGHDRLYVLARCIKNISDPTLYKLLKDYYEPAEEQNQYSLLTIEHFGNKHPNKFIYFININNDPNQTRGTVGMYATIRRILEWLNFADTLGAIPVVSLGKNGTYYDEGMDHITKNVFEYYFLPVSEISTDEVKDCYNVISCRNSHSNFYLKHGYDAKSYEITEDEIRRLGYIYKKYIHMNKTTEQFINSEILNLLNNKNTLGIHIRGTDYKLGLKGHPNVISIAEYIDITRKVLEGKNYEQIFLATDDLGILKKFQDDFGDKLVYYNDVVRTSGKVGPHNTYNERPLHYYKLGLEVIRDVYTLASCDSLICGLSQVSFAARYVKISMSQEYNTLRIIDHGIKQ